MKGMSLWTSVVSTDLSKRSPPTAAKASGDCSYIEAELAFQGAEGEKLPRPCKDRLPGKRQPVLEPEQPYKNT